MAASILPIISLFGLYGYAFKVGIGRVSFWRIFAVFKFGSQLLVMIFFNSFCSDEC